MVDFTNIKSIEIPEGTVKKIEIGGVTLWQSGSSPTPTPRLPAEYQEVEWIKGNGTEYIDTNVFNTGTTIVTLEASMPHKTSQQAFFGASTPAGVTNSQMRFSTGQNGDVNKLQYNYDGVIPLSASTSINNLDTTQKVKYTIGNGSVAFNDIVYTTYTVKNLTNTQTLFVFAYKNVSGKAVSISEMKLYSLKIEDGGTTLRDFVPCYRKSDNAIGLYDLVGETFYENLGKGSFEKGQNV